MVIGHHPYLPATKDTSRSTLCDGMSLDSRGLETRRPDACASMYRVHRVVWSNTHCTRDRDLCSVLECGIMR